MSKTAPKEKEQGYGIRANNDPSERNFAIFRYALSHLVNSYVYAAASEAQSLKSSPQVPSHCFLVTVIQQLLHIQKHCPYVIKHL